ncbi:MAG: histidine kinase [Bacteroidia bacterium]|nr:histidine kinase [Bacteroidia bacterium]
MLLMNLKWSTFVYLIGGHNRFLQNLWAWNPVLITGLRHMSIWLLGYHLYHFYQREVQTTKINAQLSLIAKQAQFDNLSAQLNPHFLFNSLNSIKSLILENPKIARRAVDLLSDLLRFSLYQKRDTTIPLEEEITLVKDYIELEKLRFEERLIVKFEIDEKLNKTRVLPLSIQLLVENALKHGIDKEMEGGLLSISIQEVEGFAEIKIHNPGQLSNENTHGLGLKNLNERLQLLYKGEAHFTIEEMSDTTVLATLILPIKHHV